MSTSKKPGKRTTSVREHPRHVAISPRNPAGITIVDQHLRRLKGTYLDPTEIDLTFKNYDRTGLTYPRANKLNELKNADKYDETIAIWSDYFNKKFKANPKLDPDIIKALIASESDFRIDPRGNKIALGIAQITRETLKILQDPTGECKDFIFNKMRLMDLKNPDIAIPLATRWIFRKRETAMKKLGHEPSPEELILEYKGLLKSKSGFKNSALEKFRKHYGDLKSK